MEIVGYIFFFILVIAGAYYCTKWISKRSLGTTKNRNLKVVEKVALDKDKSFVTLKHNDKIYLVGITNQNITVIDTLVSQEEIKKEELSVVPSFQETLMNLIKKGVAYEQKIFKKNKTQ